MSEKNQREQMVIETAKNLNEVFMELMDGVHNQGEGDNGEFTHMKYVLATQLRAMALYFCPNIFNDYANRLDHIYTATDQELQDGQYMQICRDNDVTLSLRLMQDRHEQCQQKLTEEEYDAALEQLLQFLEEKHLTPREDEVQVEQDTLYVMNQMTNHRATV